MSLPAARPGTGSHTPPAPGDALRAVAAQIPEWRGRRLRCTRLAGGIINQNWKLRVAGEAGAFFVKIPGPDAEIFIDRQAARQGSTRAGELGIGPKLRHSLADSGAEVQEFLAGYRSATAHDLLRPAFRRRVARAYRTLHQSPRFARDGDGFQQIADHVRTLRRLGAALPRDWEALTAGAARVEAAVRAAGFDLAPCFNDGYVSNYMLDDRGEVRIVDWEYAANNDPFWDLAVFSTEGFLETRGRRDLLEAYCGRPEACGEARIAAYEPLVCLKWGLWALLQSHFAAIPFDLAKYAALLFLRARAAFAAPGFANALARL